MESHSIPTESSLRRDPAEVDPIAAIDVQSALEGILTSREFSRSERLQKFLRYIVEQCLRHPDVVLKEYSIATNVYDRPESFDPRSDPIVRVEARRLRAKLAEYYRGEGYGESIEISVPSGAYVPVICSRSPMPVAPPSRSEALPSRIAVKPFVSVATAGSDPDEFSRGLTEEILHSLIIEQVSIVAPDSDTGLDPEWARPARERPPVDAVLHGAIRRSAAEVRVSARLTRRADGAIIWSDIYESATADFQAQRRIAGAIARAVKETCGGPDRQARTPAPDALPGSESRRDVVASLVESVAGAPGAVDLHVGLAEAWILAAIFGHCAGAAVLPKISEAAVAALGVSPDRDDARSIVALAAALATFDFASAEREVQANLVRRPEPQKRLSWYRICCLLLQRRFPEAFLECISEPHRLDAFPLWHWPKLLEGRIELARISGDMRSEFFLAHWLLGTGYEDFGIYEGAVSSYQRADLLSSGTASKAALGRVYALMGRCAEADKVLNELSALSSSSYVSPFDIASIYAALGDAEHTLEALERARQDCCPWLIALSSDGRFRRLRGNPAFERLLTDLSVASWRAASA